MTWFGTWRPCGYTSGIGSWVVVRTCVGCRRRDSQSDLLRVVAWESAVVPDGRDRQPGRGAYLHPNPECLALAERRRALPRALRTMGPLSLEVLRAAVSQASERPPGGAGDEMSTR